MFGLRHFLIFSCMLLLSASRVAGDQPVPAGPELLKGFVHPPAILNPGEKYNSDARKYQGVASIERAPGGRLWASWYAGSVKEDRYNYSVASTSGDDGKTWSDLKLVIDPDGDGELRACDPCLWLDPNGKLWLFWWLNEKPGWSTHVTMAITTDNPDDENPVWTKPRALFPGVMLNKPTVSANGEWLMPTAMWYRDESCRLIVSGDLGKTWSLRGTATVPENRRSCDEPMIVERRDGSLWQVIRTGKFGLAESVSIDGGSTWTEAKDFLPDASSRFFLRRLNSGNLMLVKHGPLDENVGRSRMTAYLSQDDGKTWLGGLLIDERNSAAYPDGTQAPDGTIYVTYDWRRADDKNILMAVFTEADIRAGAFVSAVARTRVLIDQAAGINPKPWLKEKAPVVPSLEKNGNGTPLAAGPMAEIDPQDGQVRPLEVGQPIFSNRNYTFNDRMPDCLSGKNFLFSRMERSAGVCRKAGMVYVLTPRPDRSKDSAARALEQQGFSRVAVPEYILFSNREANACSLYQKYVEAGETVEFGKWGVMVTGGDESSY
jgi:hypothetical protein